VKCPEPDKYKHSHIEYYGKVRNFLIIPPRIFLIDYFSFFSGECRTIPKCEPEELVDFPRRMKEWLFNVMEELAERSELSPYYKDLQIEAKGYKNVKTYVLIGQNFSKRK